jgi:glucose-6-phosphate 1-dehydrogenase
VATLQPDEGFDLYVQVKALGEPFRLTTQRFSFRYADVFGPIGDAYETLILDILKGNLSLFVSDEEVDYAWRLYDDLLKQKIPVYRYKAGTDGPAELNRLGMGTELVD